MPTPVIGMIGASIGSSVIGASAAKKAGAGQTAAANKATKLQQQQFEQTTENYKPYLEAGNNGLAAFLYEMGLGPKPGGVRPTIETIPSTYGSVGDRGSAGGATSTGSRFRVSGQEFGTLAEAEEFANKNTTGGYGGYSVSPMAKYLMEEGVDGVQGAAAASGGLYSGATLEALEADRRRVISADTSDYFSKLFGLTNMGMAAAGNQAGAGANYANNVGNLQMQAAQNAGNARMQGAQAIQGGISDAAGIYGYFNNPMAAYASPTMNSSPMPKANPYL